MEKTKTLWFRAGVEVPLTLEEYLTICRGGWDDADEASREAAKQLLFSRFQAGKFRLSGETYTPMLSKDPKTEWPQEDELSFDFNGEDFPPPDRIQVKVIDDNGNCTFALANTTQPIEVELVRIDKDFEDYQQLQDYSEELQKDPQYRECDLIFAHFEPDEQLNTKISYLYRDGGNYHVHNEVIIRGVLSDAQIKRILECADGDGWFAGNFIPSRVGLPERTMVDEGFDYDEELDTPWFEIDEDGFETTADEPTVEITPEELVAAFERCVGHWQNPISASFKLATIHFTSVEEGASATQFDTQDCGELMELFHHFIAENKLTLKSIDSVDFGEGTE